MQNAFKTIRQTIMFCKCDTKTRVAKIKIAEIKYEHAIKKINLPITYITGMDIKRFKKKQPFKKDCLNLVPRRRLELPRPYGH